MTAAGCPKSPTYLMAGGHFGSRPSSTHRTTCAACAARNTSTNCRPLQEENYQLKVFVAVLSTVRPITER